MKVFFQIATALFLSFIHLVQAEVVIPPEDFSSPRKTMNFYLKAMKSYKLGYEESLILAIKTFEQDHLDPATKEYILSLAAKKLVRTIDKLEYIKIETIPEKLKTSYWVYKKSIVQIDGTKHAVEISLAKNKNGNWLFSKKTLETIDYFERSLENTKFVKGVIVLESFSTRIEKKLPHWLRENILGIRGVQWIFLVLLLFISFVADRFLRYVIIEKVTKVFAKKNISINEKKKKKFMKPLGLIIASAIFLVGIRLLELTPEVYAIFHRLAIISLTFFSVLTAHNFVDIVCIYLEKMAKESETKFDDILVPLIRKTAKTLVVIFGLIFIGNSLTINMKGILAGLGIGGIAFALAAKDTLSNLFGSLTVLLDRPFSIGDWVVFDDKIEGTVVEVGLRSTRIKTFYDSIITVPNGKLTNIHIDNYGLRKFRRYNTKIGVQYDTPPEKVEAFCEGIRQIILAHKWTRKDYFHVYLNGLGDSSLEILLYLFWEVPDWSAELQEKHRILIDILRLGKSMGVEFAFPTQTLHLYNEEKSSFDIDLSKSPLELGKEQANQIVQKPISTEFHRSSNHLRE